jgi:hypothetical protein
MAADNLMAYGKLKKTNVAARNVSDKKWNVTGLYSR